MVGIWSYSECIHVGITLKNDVYTTSETYVDPASWYNVSTTLSQRQNVCWDHVGRRSIAGFDVRLLTGEPTQKGTNGRNITKSVLKTKVTTLCKQTQFTQCCIANIDKDNVQLLYKCLYV